MILEIYLTLFGIGLLLVICGHFMLMDALRFTGFTMLFLIGMVFLTGNLQYADGWTETVVGNTTYRTINYTTITDSTSIFGTVTYHTIALIQVLAAIAGFIYVFVDRREARESNEEG